LDFGGQAADELTVQLGESLDVRGRQALAYTGTRALAPGPAFRSPCFGHARPFGQLEKVVQ